MFPKSGTQHLVLKVVIVDEVAGEVQPGAQQKSSPVQSPSGAIAWDQINFRNNCTSATIAAFALKLDGIKHNQISLRVDNFIDRFIFGITHEH